MTEPMVLNRPKQKKEKHVNVNRNPDFRENGSDIVLVMWFTYLYDRLYGHSPKLKRLCSERTVPNLFVVKLIFFNNNNNKWTLFTGRSSAKGCSAT